MAMRHTVHVGRLAYDDRQCNTMMGMVSCVCRDGRAAIYRLPWHGTCVHGELTDQQPLGAGMIYQTLQRLTDGLPRICGRQSRDRCDWQAVADARLDYWCRVCSFLVLCLVRG